MKTAFTWYCSGLNKSPVELLYYLDPYGCAKNQVDAENMMARLNDAGWSAAENPENADLIIVNSCGFIESAKQESINAVLEWRKLYPEKKILLAGCLAQRYAHELAEALPEADGFFGVDDLPGIAEAAGKTMAGKCDKACGKKPAREGAPIAERKTAGPGSRPLLSLPGSAYVKISEGCDNRCSFCAIPLIRGGIRSRAIRELTEECKTLLRRGIKELCLIGQDTGSYGKDFAGDSGSAVSSGLPALMEALSRLEGDFWVRILYIHPDHFPLPILDMMDKDKRFLPYFDIPFQHASEKILKNMNRRLDVESYLELIETIRRRLPDAVIRSTFMTGFPGETEEDFTLLLDFQKKARLDWLGCFVYSREENTAAYAMKGRVGKKTAIARKSLIEERQIPITENQISRFVGRTFDVLVEEKFDSPPDEAFLYLGRLPCQAPEVDGAAVIFSPRSLELGSKVPCRVIAARGFDLEVCPL